MNFEAQSALKSAILGLPETATINVAIAYDEVSAGRRGMDLFCALRRDVPARLDLHCDLWRFDLVGLPGIREAALLAARHAQIVVVGTRADIDLPASVKDWLNQSFAAKSPGSTAVVALLHSPRPDCLLALSPSRASLELLACRRKLPFFAQAAQEARPQRSLNVEVQRARATPTSAVLEETLHRHPPPPRWGINE
jgi:hypothetical protein